MKETLNIPCACYNSIKKPLTCIHKLLSPQQQKLSKRACLIAKIPNLCLQHLQLIASGPFC